MATNRKNRHPWEVMRDELAEFVEHESDMLADYLTDNEVKPPFAEKLSEREQLMRYLRLQPEDWEMRLQEHGLPETMRYYAKMELLREKYGDMPL